MRTSDLQPYQQRVIEERLALAEKIEKLTTFIAGKTWSTLPENERHSLVSQSSAMQTYLHILDQRIATFIPK